MTPVPECKVQAVCVRGRECLDAGRCLRAEPTDIRERAIEIYRTATGEQSVEYAARTVDKILALPDPELERLRERLRKVEAAAREVVREFNVVQPNSLGKTRLFVDALRRALSEGEPKPSPAACLALAIVRYFQCDDEDGMLEALTAHHDVLPAGTWMRPDVWEKYENAEHTCCEGSCD